MPTPQSILDARFIEEDLLPHVKNIRLALFGTPNSPFKELDEAMRWIEHNKSSRTDELIDRTVYEGQVFESKRKGSKVDRLFQEAYQISNFTGATFGSSVMHILINSSLVLQSVQWLMMGIGSKSKSLGTFSRKSRKLIISGPITFEEMRMLHRDIRRYFGKTKSKQADTEDLEFANLVDVKGGPPTKMVVAFWEEIQHEWNQRHPEKQYTTWKGVQRRFNLLVKRFKPSKS